MKQYCETITTDDGFTYELWRRETTMSGHLYYAADRFTKEVLLGGCVAADPEEIIYVMNLPR